MCKLMLSINFEENKESANFFSANRDLFKAEKDGTVAFTWNNLKNPKSVAFESTDKAIDYIASQSQHKGVFGVHTRTATSGLLIKDNLHFWIKDGYSFAHNGLVYQLSGISQKDSDSRLFFQLILRQFHKREKGASHLKVKTRAKIIANLMDEMGFSGVAFLLDIKNKLLYLLGTRNIDVYSDMKSFITFSSFNASVNYQKIVNYAGIGFVVTGLELPISHNMLSSGIYVYDIEKREIVYQQERPDEYMGYRQQWHSYSDNYSFEFDRSVPVEDEKEAEVESKVEETEAVLEERGNKKYFLSPVKINEKDETSEEYLKRKGYLDD